MGRARDPNREKAFDIYKSSGGGISLIDIANQLNVPEGSIRGWKAKDRWDSLLNGASIDSERSNESNGAERNVIRNATNVPERSESEGDTKERISWIEVENAYVTDMRMKPCTLEQLSKKYGISHSWIMQYAAEHNWTDKRRKHIEQTKEKAAEITTNILSSDIAKATARHLRISDKLLKVVEDALQDDKEFYKVVEKLRTGYGPGEFDEKIVVETVGALNDAKLLNVVNSFEKIQKSQRQTLAILDEKDRRKIELDERKAAGETDTEDDLIEDWVSGVVGDEEKGLAGDEAEAPGVQD